MQGLKQLIRSFSGQSPLRMIVNFAGEGLCWSRRATAEGGKLQIRELCNARPSTKDPPVLKQLERVV